MAVRRPRWWLLGRRWYRLNRWRVADGLNTAAFLALMWGAAFLVYHLGA